MNQIRVKFNGLDYNVEYTFKSGMYATYDSPDEPDELEIYNVYHEGVEVSEALDDVVEDFIDVVQDAVDHKNRQDEIDLMVLKWGK